MAQDLHGFACGGIVRTGNVVFCDERATDHVAVAADILGRRVPAGINYGDTEARWKCTARQGIAARAALFIDRTAIDENLKARTAATAKRTARDTNRVRAGAK
jgi:hypothetical protein